MIWWGKSWGKSKMGNIDEALRSLSIRYNPRSLIRSDIPSEPGVYAWWSRTEASAIYVGKAFGSSGLRRRIWGQHLSPSYLERREAKFRSQDTAQIQCSQELGRPCVEKSVLRRSLACLYGFVPGEQTVEYMRENLLVSWFIVTPESTISVPDLELEVIRVLSPQLNVAGKKRDATP